VRSNLISVTPLCLDFTDDEARKVLDKVLSTKVLGTKALGIASDTKKAGRAKTADKADAG
jgi:hypothetical protein